MPAEGEVRSATEGKPANWSNLPVAPLIGRDAELAEVLDLLDDPTVRLISVTGRGGAGKTRLALEAVRVLESSRTGSTLVVPLASITDPDLVLHQIGLALALPTLPGASPLDAVAQRLGRAATIVVLDNMEHLLDAAGTFPELLGRCPELRLLVTSQAPLKLRAERVIRLGPLPSADGEQLYCDRARAVDASFRVHEDNTADVERLCRELEGLPLAIELVAARAPSIPAREALRRLADEGLDVVRGQQRDLPDRHLDLRATIAWTYGILEAHQQRLLRRLSVIVGPFGVDDVSALAPEPAGDLFDTITALADLHLLAPHTNAEPIRYELATSIRQFAHEQLAADDDHAEVEQRWLAWCAAQARAASIALDTPDEGVARRRIAAHHDRLVAALGSCIERDDPSRALDLLTALVPHWLSTGLQPRYEQLLDEALALADSGQLDTASHAEVLVVSALLTRWHLDEAQRARTFERLARGELLAETVGDDRTRLRALSCRLLVTPITGDYTRGLDVAQAGLELATRQSSPNWSGRFEVWSGMLAHQLGDDERAIALGRAGLARARQTNDERTIVLAGMLLAPMASGPSSDGAGATSLDEVVALARRTGQIQVQLAALPMLIVAAIIRGELRSAAQWCVESLDLVSTDSSSPLTGYSLMATAQIAEAAGDPEAAARFHGMVRPLLPLLAPGLPPEYASRYDDVVEAVERDLGATTFEAAASAGGDVGWSDGVDEALALVEPLAGPAETRSTGRQDVRRRSNHGALSARQLEVLRLLATGLTNKEIAERLAVTPKTVMHHTTVVYRKLGVRGRSEAAAWATRTGLLD